MDYGQPFLLHGYNPLWLHFYVPFFVWSAFSIGWIINLAVYLIFTGALYSMCKKAGTPYAWLAFVPIAQLWPLLWTINRSAWNVLWLIIPIVGWIFSLYWLGQLMKSFGRSPWLVLLTFIPIGNLIFAILFLYVGYAGNVRYVGDGPFGQGRGRMHRDDTMFYR